MNYAEAKAELTEVDSAGLIGAGRERCSPVVAQRRRLLVHPAFIFAVALALRLATGAIILQIEGHKTIDEADFGLEAVGIAQSLASGHGFSAPFQAAGSTAWPSGSTAWLTPLMPAILAADMLLFGLHSRATLIVFVIFNELCSALTIFPMFFAARRIAAGRISGGRIPGHRISGDLSVDRIAALAAWLWVLSPVAGLAACKMIWYTSLSGLLAALLLWATLTVRDSKTPAVWIGYGLLWGAQLMTHPSFLVLMPVGLLWLGLGRLSSKQLKLPVLACVTAVLCCVPWTVRNYAVFHHFVPLRSNFGLELWRYNNGGPLGLHPNRDAEERDAFSSLGEYAYAQEKQREAVVWIRSHPGRFMRGSAQRVMNFWFDLAYGLKFVHQGGAWFWKVKLLYICALLVMVLGGLTTIRRRRREYFWLLTSFPALFPLVYYVTLARDLYRFPIDPILAVIAAFAVSAWLPAQPPDTGNVDGLAS